MDFHQGQEAATPAAPRGSEQAVQSLGRCGGRGGVQRKAVEHSHRRHWIYPQPLLWPQTPAFPYSLFP